MPLFQFVSPKQAKEGKRIVKTPLTVQTKASIDDINHVLASRVRVAADRSNLNVISAMLYIHSKTENQIIYACGNKVNPKMFIAELCFSQNGGQLIANFKILSHYEQNGIVVQLDLLNQLRNDVRSALMSFDSSTVACE